MLKQIIFLASCAPLLVSASNPSFKISNPETKKRKDEFYEKAKPSELKSSQVTNKPEERNLFTNINVSPIGSDTAISINVLRYQIQLGETDESIAIPFFLVFGESTNDNNDQASNTLLDPTDGWHLKLPFNFRFGQDWKRMCNFINDSETDYGCRAGIELDLMWKEFENTDVSKTSFGYSIKAHVAGLFPVTEIISSDNGSNLGYLNIELGAIYHFYNDKDLQDTFGAVTDADGMPYVYEDSFGALSFNVELEVYNQLYINFKYINPFKNDENLDNFARIGFEQKF